MHRDIRLLIKSTLAVASVTLVTLPSNALELTFRDFPSSSPSLIAPGEWDWLSDESSSSERLEGKGSESVSAVYSIFEYINQIDSLISEAENIFNCWRNLSIKTLRTCFPFGNNNDILGRIGWRPIYNPSLGVLSDNPFILYQELLDLQDEESARLLASSFLGEPGKQWQEQEKQLSLTILSNQKELASSIETNVAAAQKKKITQEIIKDQLKNQQKFSEIQLNQSQQIDNLKAQTLIVIKEQAKILQLQADINESLGEINRHNRMSRDSAYKEYDETTIYLPGLWNSN